MNEPVEEIFEIRSVDKTDLNTKISFNEANFQITA